MDKFKKNVIKIVIGGVALFAFGIFVGYQLNYGTIASIQGYLFNAAGEASDSNASDSNASDANASDANASSANASSANANATDNIIYLQNFSLSKTTAIAGDKVNVTITTSGACNSGASIVFKNANGTSFTAQVQDITGNPYIIVPNSAVATTYSVTDVLLIGRNSDNTTFTKQYSKSGDNTYAFNSILTVTAKEINNDNNTNNVGTESVNKLTLNSISLESTSAKVSDKVYLNVNASEKLNSLKLVFTSDDGKTFTVYAKDLATTKPYIEIPSSTVGGTYSLTSVIISTSKSSTAYSKNGDNDTEKFDFNSTIEISDESETTFIYNNEDINSDILTKLYNAPNGSEIIINADSNTLINEELFNAIKGKDKKLIINYKVNQIIFNGRDINSSKTIDITMTVDKVSHNEYISKLVSNGIVVNFPNNGNLPGKALIRVKATDNLNILNNNVYIYVYNESSNNFCVVDTNVKKSTDGYYEFAITHNSDYLIVNEKLDSKLVVNQSSNNIVDFQKSNKTLLMLVAVGIIVVVAAIIVIIVLIKKNKSTLSKTLISNNDINNNNNL